MQTQQQVVPIRTPESSYGDEVVTVIAQDGSTGPADPKLPLEQVVDFYEAMVRTRTIDVQLERLQRQGRIGFSRALQASARRPRIHRLPRRRIEDSGLAVPRPTGEFGDRCSCAAACRCSRYVDDMVRQRRTTSCKGTADALTITRSGRSTSSPISSPIGTQMTHAAGFGDGPPRSTAATDDRLR